MKTLSSLVKRSAQLTAGIACALALAAGVPSIANAQVLTTDIVCGKTADARGITAENLPDIDATNAIVMSKDGSVYYARSADEQVKIASITKVMTAILTVENCKMDEKITVSNAAATVGNSTAGLLEGDELTVEQALRGLMIPSGNDAAIALAEHVGKKIDPKTKDAVATFVKAMNERAKKLGCTGTLFENPHGLDFDEWTGDMHSTAHDVALMMQEAMKSDTFREIVASDDSWIEVTGADGSDHSHSMDTHNELLGQDGNIGGKTGTTDDAGYCFTGAYNRDGDETYTVVLNSSTTDQRTQQRHTRRCKALGGQRSVGCRQAEHQVRPGGQRSPGTHPGGKQRRSTALHHARAAHAHHRLKAAFFQLRYLPGVSVVERVVFRDDTGCSHGCLASFGRCARINCESWPFFSLFLARFRPCA